MSINSLFQTGSSIINAAGLGQVAVGQNLAGIYDKNYHRVNTILSAIPYGVNAKFTRAYNQYTERSFVQEASSENRWTTQDDLLGNIQELFNESGERVGMGKTLTKFLNSWNALASNPTNIGSKTEVLELAQTLIQLLQGAGDNLNKQEQEVNAQIGSQVSKVNGLLDEIATINKLVQGSRPEDVFSLLDKRDALTRELSEYIDVDIVNSDNDSYTITTKSGYTLVNGSSAYKLSLESNVVTPELVPGSAYTGTVHFSGTSNYEYTIEMIEDGPAGTAKFRASIDGGKTWITNPETGDSSFTSALDGKPVKVGDLEITFDAGVLTAGDSFTIVPKLGLFWESTSASKVNITPQDLGNGTENSQRISGGTLAGLFSYRDNNGGIYKDKLEAFAKSLIWEVNSRYSQSAGTPQNSATGNQQVGDTTVPLTDIKAKLPFGDKLTNGTITLYEFDTNGKGIAHEIAFDPETESLDDLVTKIKATGGNITASITAEGTLKIEGTGGKKIAFGKDTTGVMAGLGMNTFFTGSSIENMGVNGELVRNPSSLNTGSVGSDGSISVGSNDIALGLSNLQNEAVTVTDALGNETKSTLFEYYNSIAGKVGSDKDNASFQKDYFKTQAGFWYAKGQSESGVSQDEEMTNSMQLQNLYVAGTKLIDTARKMLDQLLSVV